MLDNLLAVVIVCLFNNFDLFAGTWWTAVSFYGLVAIERSYLMREEHYGRNRK